MDERIPAVIMRSCNDMPLIAQTLKQLSEQDQKFHLIALDNESTDGTREELARYTDHIVTIKKGTYIPGRVLNRGMKEAEGYDQRVVFLNSDCTPYDSSWLSGLLSGFSSPEVAAVFGRQIPREDCRVLFAKDTEDTYGDGSKQQYWKHCFSMASSAIFRPCWEESAFREDIQYSEDIDWTYRARMRGWKILYVKDSIVYHSHNYSFKAFRKRHFGEGKAEAAIFEWSDWERTFLRYSLLPFARQVLNDVRYGVKHHSLEAVFTSPYYRYAQLLGRRAGFKEGIREMNNRDRI